MQARLPKLSSDAGYAALIDIGDQELVIFSRPPSPSLIDQSRQGVADAAWAPDNSLYYSDGTAIYRIPPDALSDSSRDVLVQRFDADGSGNVRRLAISPDGHRIAFSRITDSTLVSQDTTLWIMNSDGSDPRPFAQGPGGAGDNLDDPVWSPDGRWILAALSAAADPGATGFNTPSGLIALNSELSDYTIGTSSGDQISVRAICFDDPADCSSTEPRVLGPRVPASWIP